MLPLLLLALNTADAVPIQMTHQGRLLDANGAAITGLHLLTFAVYDAETGGNLDWTETLAVQFNNGYYATILGSDEMNNPLDSTVLEVYPLYLEISVDQGTPLSPRTPINSVPYAQIAGLAEQASSLNNGPVDATEIAVNGQGIIDSNGNWIGPTTTVMWSDIDPSTIPSGIADGDNDTLANLSCAIGEIAAWSGASWVCASDNTLSLSDIQNVLNVSPADLHPSTTIGGLDIVTPLDDSDTLAGLSCSDGDIAKYDIVQGDWYCDADATITETQVEQYIENGAIDLATGSTMNGQMLVTAPPNCSDGQILSFDSSTNAWTCMDFSAIIDQDGDGAFAWLDCDDNNANLGSQATDADCDGFDTTTDCDDGAATITDSGTGATSDCPASSCLEILNNGYSNGDGVYYIDFAGVSTAMYCDMTTNNGGWTVIYAATGANGETPITSDATRNGNPLSFQHYNATRAQKVALSSIGTETLFKKNNGSWIKANQTPFESTLLNSNQHDHMSVTLTSSNGTTASGFMGWSNFNISGGGDFNLSQTDGTTCSGARTTSNGVDHHSSSYYHLNCGCDRHYLYSYSNASGDGDAGYDASASLGAWGVTQACDSAEGGALRFFMAIR